MQRPRRRALAVRLSIHLAFGAALPAQACWDDAAQRYQVSSALLYAIARTESGLNPQAIGRNGNGSRDIGLMQINSAWLPTLASHGINERDLFEPCTNIHVGAWILAGNVSRLGYTWDAVGAYNATRPALRRLCRQGAPPPACRYPRPCTSGAKNDFRIAALAGPASITNEFLPHEVPPFHPQPPSTQALEIQAMSKTRSSTALNTTLVLVLTLAAGSALAGTTGTEFQTMYTTLLNWATGFLGKSIAIAAFILGAGIGIARSSPIPALAGVVFALFMVYVPTIIDSIMTAVI
jgi:hypothetical protein